MAEGSAASGDTEAQVVADIRHVAPLARPAVITAGASLVPAWLDNLAALSWRLLAAAALVIVSALLANLLWTVTASIAVAVVVAAVFAPSVLRLRARGWSRTKAASAVWVAVIVVASVVVVLLAATFLPYLAELVTRLRSGVTAIQGTLTDASIPPFVGTMIEDVVDSASSTAGDAAGSLVASIASGVTIAILAFFLVFFFLRDGDKAWIWSFQAVSDGKRERITAAGDDALARVGGYLRGTTVLAGLIGLTNAVFLLVLGVPLALPLAILSFLAGYIPYFGGIVTTAVILLVAYAANGSTTAILLLVLMSIRNAVLAYGVRPAVYGRTVSIHPALVLLALPAGYQLGGIVGLFAAVPITAVVLAVSAATVAILDPDPRPALPGLVPAWLDRVAQVAWRVLIVVGLLAMAVVVLQTIPLVIIPLILGVILAATFEPVVQALMARGHHRGRASAMAVGGAFVIITLTLALTMVVLVDQAAEIGATMTDGAGSASSILGGHLDLSTDAVAAGASVIVRTAIAFGEAIVSIAVVSVLSALLSFYLLRDGAALWRRVSLRVPSSVAPQVDAAAGRAAEVLGGYMFGTAAISFVGAASQLVIMLVLGLPLALPIFVLSFFLCFIPYIGGFISTGIAFLVTVAVGSPLDVGVMLIWTVVFNLVTGNIVGPIVYGKTVHLHPAIVLLAIPAGSAVAGILGMFLVVPLLGVVAATWRTVLIVMAWHASAGSGTVRAAAPRGATRRSPDGAAAARPGPDGSRSGGLTPGASMDATRAQP